MNLAVRDRHPAVTPNTFAVDVPWWGRLIVNQEWAGPIPVGGATPRSRRWSARWPEDPEESVRFGPGAPFGESAGAERCLASNSRWVQFPYPPLRRSRPTVGHALGKGEIRVQSSAAALRPRGENGSSHSATNRESGVRTSPGPPRSHSETDHHTSLRSSYCRFESG